MRGPRGWAEPARASRAAGTSARHDRPRPKHEASSGMPVFAETMGGGELAPTFHYRCPGKKPYPSKNGPASDVHYAPVVDSHRLSRDQFAAFETRSISDQSQCVDKRAHQEVIFELHLRINLVGLEDTEPRVVPSNGWKSRLRPPPPGSGS